jgi:hypothetical protein
MPSGNKIKNGKHFLAGVKTTIHCSPIHFHMLVEAISILVLFHYYCRKESE